MTRSWWSLSTNKKTCFSETFKREMIEFLTSENKLTEFTLQRYIVEENNEPTVAETINVKIVTS